MAMEESESHGGHQCPENDSMVMTPKRIIMTEQTARISIKTLAIVVTPSFL